MKTFFAFLLLLLSNAATAQSVVLRSSDERAKRLGDEFDKQYRSSVGEIFETSYSIQSSFRNACLRILPAEKMLDESIRGVLYVNEAGKVDYFIFTLEKQMYRTPSKDGSEANVPKLNLDSLSEVFAKGIKPYIDSIISRRTIGRKAALGIFTSFYPQKKISREPQDSIIYNLETAGKIIDTLKVKELAFGQSLLTNIPDVIYRFPNLERLLLNNNDLEVVKIDMAKLPKLQQIDLSGNILKHDQIDISKNKSLKLLNLLKNQITDVPKTVKKCKRLETLWLGTNQISSLSNKSFRRAKMIKDLNLYKAGISELPRGIKKLKKLEVLDLYYNDLEMLPSSICKLKRLTHLAISHNQIAALPEKIYKLKNVHTLYAHHNHLSKLPVGIVRMQNLQILDLGYNWFTNFPAQLTAFTKLQELDLSSNNFPEFPEQLLKIQKLDKLYLRGNPFINENVGVKYNDQFSLLKSKNIEVFY